MLINIDGVETPILADLNRMDLVEKGISTNGNNAFHLDVGVLPEGTEIAAFVAADGLELQGSPIVVGE